MIIIANNGQGSALRRAHLKVQLLLQRIGVLILVNKDGLQSTGEVCQRILLQSIQNGLFQLGKVQQLSSLHRLFVILKDLIQQLSCDQLFRGIAGLQKGLPVQQVMAAAVQQRAKQSDLCRQIPRPFPAAAKAEQERVDLRVRIAAVLQQSLAEQGIGQSGVGDIGDEG